MLPVARWTFQVALRVAPIRQTITNISSPNFVELLIAMTVAGERRTSLMKLGS
jgi:hypothetical protein